MVRRKLFSSFCFGSNRGAIFTLDSIIAVFVVLIILTISVFFMARSEEPSISDIQASRIANDIFALLDYQNILRNFNIFEINTEINSLLPKEYTMEYKIECDKRKYDSRTNLTTIQQSIFSGERVFIDSKFNNCVVRYWIWTK